MNWFRSLSDGLARWPGRLAHGRRERQAQSDHHQSEAERLDRIRHPAKYLARVNADPGPPKINL